MLRLNHPTAPFWLDLGHGVRLHLAPFTTALMLAVRAELRRDLADDQPDEATSGEEKTRRFANAVARVAILDWEGVALGESDEPAPCDAAHIDALMDIYQIHDAFQRLYIAPRMMLDAEKNVSSPAPNGTSAGALDTAAGAKAPVPSAPTP